MSGSTNRVNGAATTGADAAPAATRVRGPRWRDLRLVVGLVLVLASVAVGVRLFAAADQTTAVWAAKHELDAGAVLDEDDLVKRQVRLPDTTEKYVAADSVPAEYVLTRAVGRGELLPSSALRSPRKARARRLVTVPVSPGHLPAKLAANHRVDVYVTPKDEAGDSKGGDGENGSELVVEGAPVVTPGGDRRLGAASSEVGVVLAVAPDDVAPLLEAVRHGEVDLVGRPLGAHDEGGS